MQISRPTFWWSGIDAFVSVCVTLVLRNYYVIITASNNR